MALRHIDIAKAGTAAAEAISGADIDTPTTPTASSNACVPVTAPSRVLMIAHPHSRCGRLAYVGPAAAGSALIDEAMKKSGLIWLGEVGAERKRAYWYAWLDGKIYLLTGGGEQPDPGLRERSEVDVLARSKDTWHRLVMFRARVTLLLATDSDWPEASAELAKGRLNLPDAEGAPERWAADRNTRCYRLTPTGEILEGPGEEYPSESLRAAPVPSPATTKGRLPRVFHRRDTRRRPLS
jgi:hypothetical protein